MRCLLIYGYNCKRCGLEFEVTKPAKDMEVNENCPECGEFAVRQFMPKRIHLSKTAVTHAEYNPGLGCVVQNSDHKKELCKRKGLVEIGNDFKSGESNQKHYDQVRADKAEKNWEKE